MTSRILTFQQSSVMMDIETVLDMVRKGTPAQQIKEIWEGILLLVEDEHTLYPKDLRPGTYFEGKAVFGNRASRPVMRLYLHKLHRHLDLRSSTTLPG